MKFTGLVPSHLSTTWSGSPAIPMTSAAPRGKTEEPDDEHHRRDDPQQMDRKTRNAKCDGQEQDCE